MRAESIYRKYNVKPGSRALKLAFLTAITFATMAPLVHADPVLRVTLEGGVGSTSAPHCPGSFCDGEAFTIHVFIDQINVEQRHVVDEHDGSEWDETFVSYNVRSWTPPTHGMFSALPQFSPSQMRPEVGTTQARRFPTFGGEFCCNYLSLAYSDGLNSVHFDLYTHSSVFGALDPWYGLLPSRFQVFPGLGMSSPTTGPVVWIGSVQVTEIAPVPEPGTLVLLGTGFALVGRRRFRRSERN